MARSICFYTDSRDFGGAELALLMLLRTLDRDAWQPVLLLEDDPGAATLADRARALGVPVRVVPPLPLGLEGARRVPGLARQLRRLRPDVFHAHLSWPLAAKWGLVAALAARVPAVVGTMQLIPAFPLTRPSLLQLRALAVGVDRWIAVSGDIAAQLTGDFGWPSSKVEVVRNAVELDRFGAPPEPGLRRALGVAEETPVVLTCARLDEQKGHATLLRAAADVPGAVFLLAGEGPERPALEALAAELGVSGRVRFLGRREDVPQLLSACDVFALPSLYEGTSLAVLEAMAARRPVVSSGIGGTDELVEDGRSGLLVAPGDAAALAAALRRLLADGTLRATLAGAARARAEREFSPAHTTVRMQEIYAELLGDCRRA